MSDAKTYFQFALDDDVQAAKYRKLARAETDPDKGQLLLKVAGEYKERADRNRARANALERREA